GDRPTIFAANAAVSVTGTIQPAVFAASLGSKHFVNGLASRLLVAMPPPAPRVWTERDVDASLLAAVEDIFRKMLALTMPNGQPGIVNLGADAKALWVAYYNRHGSVQETLSGDFAAAWSKLEGYCARFALVLHVVRVAAGEDVPADEIQGADMANAIILAD